MFVSCHQRLAVDFVADVHACTHLVAEQIKRSVKFVHAVCIGAAIVTPRWLEACISAGAVVGTPPPQFHRPWGISCPAES